MTLSHPLFMCLLLCDVAPRASITTNYSTIRHGNCANGMRFFIVINYISENISSILAFSCYVLIFLKTDGEKWGEKERIFLVLVHSPKSLTTGAGSPVGDGDPGTCAIT